MKARNERSSGKGIGGLWLMVAAAAGAVAAYLGDPESGKLRREATVGRLRGALDTARARGEVLQRRVTEQLAKQPAKPTSIEVPTTESKPEPPAATTPPNR